MAIIRVIYITPATILCLTLNKLVIVRIDPRGANISFCEPRKSTNSQTLEMESSIKLCVAMTASTLELIQRSIRQTLWVVNGLKFDGIILASFFHSYPSSIVRLDTHFLLYSNLIDFSIY